MTMRLLPAAALLAAFAVAGVSIVAAPPVQRGSPARATTVGDFTPRDGAWISQKRRDDGRILQVGEGSMFEGSADGNYTAAAPDMPNIHDDDGTFYTGRHTAVGGRGHFTPEPTRGSTP